MKTYKIGLLTMIALVSSSAFASAGTNKQIDNINATGGAVIAVPSIGAFFLSDTSTATVSGKSMAGNVNTFTLIPVGAIGNGSVLSGTNTGDVTASAFGATPNANGFTLTGQAFNLQPADATHPGGLLSADWVSFNGKQPAGSYITALTGDVTASGPGSATATLATVNSNVGSFTNASITVNGKGLITAASSGTSSAPSLNGGSGSPQAQIAATATSLSSLNTDNRIWVVGTATAVTITATPSITACTSDNQILRLTGTDATKTVTYQDESNLSGSGLKLNGNLTLGIYQGAELHCDITLGKWVENSRSN